MPPRRPDSEDEHNRIYRNVAFASSDYIPWVFGRLRLGSANLGRMQTSGVPVLRSHNGDSPVGVVTNVQKNEREGLWKSDWELPKISSNADTFEQMDVGLLRGISVGGSLDMASITVDNEDDVSSIDDLLLTADWTLVEQSLTPIPADVRAGIDRTAGMYVLRGQPLFDLLIGPEGIATPDTPALRDHIRDLLREHNETIATLRREEGQQTMTTPAIPQDILERAVNERLAGDSASKQLTGLVERMDKLTADNEAEALRNMEFRNKLDKLQYQPGGQVIQMTNWNPANDPLLDMGKIIRLYADRDAGFPKLDRATTSLEESFIERNELATPGPQTVARIPWAAFEERERQLPTPAGDTERRCRSTASGHYPPLQWRPAALHLRAHPLPDDGQSWRRWWPEISVGIRPSDGRCRGGIE